jgi:hypothetical protein
MASGAVGIRIKKSPGLLKNRGIFVFSFEKGLF